MPITRDQLSQGMIFLFGVTAIILVAKKNKRGFVLGLITQPFRFITSYINGQRGVFFLSIVYAISRCYGIYEWFWKKEKK